MQEYMLLFRGGDGRDVQQDEVKWKAHMDKWMIWMEGLVSKQQFVSAQPLTPTGRTISGTKKLVSDGPFLEGREMVGGYLVCLAESYDEVVELAKSCPILDFEDGSVEIREVKIAAELDDLKE